MGGTIREITIRTLGELVEAVTPERPDPNSGRLRDAAVYRGMTDARWGLLSSLDRLGTPESAPHQKADLEEHLLRNFIRYARPYLSHAADDWEHLFMAQHHGLNTRLLDWTYSPLVAAHFATIGRARVDGVIWRLDWPRVHERFGLPERALTVTDLREVLGPLGYPTPWELSRCAQAEVPVVCMLEPPTLDARISAQGATFTLCVDKSRALDRVLEDSGLAGALTRLRIPADAIYRVRDQLDICGVTERRLFPDLDGLARDMQRYYGATGPVR